MRLEQLIEGMQLKLEQGSGGTQIQDLTDDSRQVRPGSAFIARRGAQIDGRTFIRDAIERGATAIITTCQGAPGVSDPTAATSVCGWPRGPAIITGPMMDHALAGCLAERFFGQPSRNITLLGVTGTNGKTTTAYLVQHLLRQAGIPTGLMGTLFIDEGSTAGGGADNGPGPAVLTTPSAIDLSRHLARMVANGCQAAVVEVSSHALDQGRVAALDFDAALFTNLTGDHLDYHQTMEAYAAAKASLFKQLEPTGWGILNADDPHAHRMARDCRAGLCWTSLREPAADQQAGRWYRAQVLTLTDAASRARFDGPWGRIEVSVPLVGPHNVSNALQAVAMAHCVTNMTRYVRQALENAPPVPGRLERLSPWADAESRPPDSDSQQEPRREKPEFPAVLVDYAHTHDALENVLGALRTVVRGRLIVLFGCGGDRDKTKRPKMAESACRLADRVFVTSDNPRTEDPEAIIRDILTGVPTHKRPDVEVICDRGEAIRRGVLSAEAVDTVLLAGKGHEDYQLIGTERRPFDDRQHGAAALRRWIRERNKPCTSAELSV